MPRLPSAALRLLARLPLWLLHGLGSVLAWTVYGTSPTFRRNLRRNLQQAGYREDRVRREAIASAGKLVAELPVLWFRPHADVARLVREAPGFEALIAARQAGRALVVLTPHLGCFEVAAQYAALHMPITVLYRPPKLGWLAPLMLEGRRRANLRLAPADVSGVRELLRALKRGEAVGFLPDQVPSKGEGEWCTFFGRPAYTMTLAARLAQREDVACFVAYARRLPRGRGYTLAVRPLLAALPGERPTRRLNRALEELVRECPGQYLWSYNRYKVPAGVPPP